MNTTRQTRLAASAVAACFAAGAMGAPIPETTKVFANDAREGDTMGAIVCIDGGIMAVSAHARDCRASLPGQTCGNGENLGAVYLFDTETMDQIGLLVAPDRTSGDGFGRGLDMQDGFIVAGAIGNSPSGSAYLFDASTGQHLFKMLPDAGSFDIVQFGWSVAVSAQYVVVGAPGDRDNGHLTGAAYVFDTQTGQRLHKLFPSNPAVGNQFGFGVHIDGDLIVVVSSNVFDYSVVDYGSIHVFDATTGDQIHDMQGRNGGGFGYSVDVEDGIIAVGNSMFGPGYAALYDAATGDEIAQVTPGSGTGGNHRVDLSDGRLLVGRQRENAAGLGGAAIYDASTGAEITNLELPAGSIEQEFGIRVDLDGDRAVVATLGDRITTFGSAYMYDANTGARIADLIRSDAGATSDAWGRTGGDMLSTADQFVAITAPWDSDAAHRAGAIYIWDLSCPADLTGDGNVNFFDISEYIALFNAQDPAADLAEPFGSLNFFDISAYITLFNQGCP